eukprot:TRINITY_DN20798_c0_g1_i1.p1 TRINITY_DN20798_c0_g1~~TRINITY_DN20798_c0_g1_i1.p1  ORF type:complete len:151 (-),score=29.43 TRINITY_DN20798_c0_g1_i1:10-462(-)
MSTMKTIFLLLLSLKLFSESSSSQICLQLESHNITFDPVKIRDQSFYDELTQKYVVDWMAGVEPSHFGVCFKSAVLHYHGGTDKNAAWDSNLTTNILWSLKILSPFRSLLWHQFPSVYKFILEEIKESFAFQLRRVPDANLLMSTWFSLD